MTWRALGVTCAASLVAGCMATRVGRLPDAPWPVRAPGGGKTVSLVVKIDATLNGSAAEPGHLFQVWPEDATRWRDEIVRAYVESGLFSNVQLGLAPADVRATVQLAVADEFDQRVAMLGGTTLSLLPVYGDMIFKMRTELRGEGGTLVDPIDVRANRRVWIQLFLFPFGMVGQPRHVSTDIVRDLTRATLDRAAAAGLLAR
jgi:hypothetical protein